jgi:hypothetical protein
MRSGSQGREGGGEKILKDWLWGRLIAGGVLLFVGLVKFTLEHTMKAERGCRGIAVLFL